MTPNQQKSETDGFVRVPNSLIEHSDLTLHELVVYVVLLKYRNPVTGKCWPGLSVIADEARVSHKTATRTIKSLEDRGVITVTRARGRGEKNRSNVYEVALYDEKLQCWIGQSAKGTRQPKRHLSSTDSESLPVEVADASGDSQSLPRDSESVGVGTPSPSNKIKENKINDLAMRSETSSTFTFATGSTKPSALQLGYLHDLHIHLTGSIPTDRTTSEWSTLTPEDASQRIATYLRQVGRGLDYIGPEPGTPAFNALTLTGQEWALKGGIPNALEGAYA